MRGGLGTPLVGWTPEVRVGQPPSPPTDEELVVRLRAGDAPALRLLMERYERSLYGYLRRLLGTEQDAEDAFQEVFLRVLRALDRFDSQRRFRPWLYAIATNLARNLHRRRATRRALTLDAPEAGGEGEALAARLAARDPEPAEAVESAERSRAVAAAVAALPEKGRAALVLYYYQGLSYEEIAQALEIPLGTVKSRIHNAMARLDRALAPRRKEVP
ncbi:MAG: RNA polymerase sigma factor [Planctomycetota bacterium]|nr:MAG: RNA polymerase sigma factor [Planctomycetota bacterium]